MASKSNIESLEELIIKVIVAIRKSQKRPHKIRINDFTKIFLENSGIRMIYFGKEWNSLRKMALFIISLQNMEIPLIFPIKEPEVVLSPIDQFLSKFPE